MNILVSDTKQAIGNKRFLLGLLAVFFILLLSCAETMISILVESSVALRASGHHWRLFTGAMKADGMLMILPISAALPYTTSIIDEFKSGFIKLSLSRSNVTNYVCGKIVACLFSGGIVITLGSLTGHLAVQRHDTRKHSLWQPKHYRRGGHQRRQGGTSGSLHSGIARWLQHSTQ